MKIASVQMDIKPGDLESNINRACRFIKEAAVKGADIVVFPECALSDYYVDDFGALAERIPGNQSDAVSDAASRHGICVAIGLLEKTRGGVYNSAVLINADGQATGTYRKTHLSVATRNDTIAREADVFLCGAELPVYKTGLGTMGMMICKDGEYPEVSRTLQGRRECYCRLAWRGYCGCRRR